MKWLRNIIQLQLCEPLVGGVLADHREVECRRADRPQERAKPLFTSSGIGRLDAGVERLGRKQLHHQNPLSG